MTKILITVILCHFVATYSKAYSPDPYLRGVYIGTGETGQILRKILENYDPYVRPVPRGGGPTKMEIWMQAMDVTWLHDDLYLKGSFNRLWLDERLKFESKKDGRKEITVDAGEFSQLIWQPDLVFMTHYSHNVMPRGLITIFENGTVYHRNLDTAVIHLKKPTEIQKSVTAFFMGADFGNERDSVTYACLGSSCLYQYGDKGNVKVENAMHSTMTKSIANVDYEVNNLTVILSPMEFEKKVTL